MARKYTYECDECGKSYLTDDEEGEDVYVFSFEGNFGLRIRDAGGDFDLDGIYLCPGCVAKFFQKHVDRITKEAAVRKLKGNK